MLQDKYRAIMQYCIPREGMGDRGSSSANQDWYCVKCVAHNFKRRDTCFRCQASRQESEHGGEGSDEVSPHPTHTVLLRRLDVLSTEDSVLGALQTFSSRPIRSIRIGRDSLTNTSRGVCYVEMNSVTDAMYLHNALAANPPVIDGKKVFVSYCKLPQVSSSSSSAVAASTALAAAQWSHQGTGTASASGAAGGAGGDNQVTEYGPEDVPRLAEYSATLYAKTPEEHAAYLQYYQAYYASKIAEGGTIVLPTQATPVSSGAAAAAQSAIAQSAILQAQAAKEFNKQPTKLETDVGVAAAALTSGNGTIATHGTVPYINTQAHGHEYPKYPVPDVSTYQYDKSSGYYYDPQTGLYYDATSQYYYNAHAQQFLYWDHIRQTYLPAPAGADEQMQRSGEEHQAGGKDLDGKGKGKDKPDKVKVAKKIAKDMERWAKTLNQRKENARQAQAALASASMPRSSGAADAGYAVLERRDRGGEEPGRSAPPAAPILQFLQRQRDGGAGGADDDRVASSPLSMSAQLGSKGGLVAAYGEGSEGEDDGDDGGSGGVDDRHTDWTKLACLLCKRQFPSKEALIRHQQLSDLHKQNLRMFQGGVGGSDDRALNYRDRAKERRLKFGEPDQPHPNSLKEKYLKAREEAAATSYEEPTKEGIGSDNVGNKLLQKMGWQEGMGLGKSNQGRTKIVEAEGRGSTAGLGLKGSTFTVRPGETYKDSVKKLMFARYKEVADEEK